MKIGITSDTHSSLPAMRKILALTPPVELWLHAGDHYSDSRLLAELTGIRTIGVRGNCDFKADGGHIDEFLELEGYKIWITHGHKYIRRNEYADLAGWAKDLGQDIVVYGHTHLPVCTYKDGILLINPGSPSRPHNGKPSFAVLTLQKGKTPQVEFISL